MQSGKSVMNLSPIKLSESETSLAMSLASSTNSQSLYSPPLNTIMSLNTNSEPSATISITSSISSTSSTSSTSPTSSTSSSESDYCGFSMLSLVEEISNMDETILLKTNGYTKENEIGTTTQGELFLARKGEEFVVIKKIAKDLYQRKEFVSNNFTFSTDKNILKEGMILKSIAENKNPKNELILKYIDSFESDEHYYLVQEYIEDSITLKEFVIKAHQYITENKLKLKHYKKCITLILYQLSVVVNLLHHQHKLCHMDIAPENILLKQSDFIQNSDGSIDINPNVHIKLKSFGFAEQFGIDNNTFECSKQFLSLDNEQYLCPDITDKNVYDGRAIDIWAFGMTAYFCYIGCYPYEKMEFKINDLVPTPKVGSDYWAVLNGKIKQQLALHGKLKFINSKICSLLEMLLNIDSTKRLNSIAILEHKLFSKFSRSQN